MEYLNIVINVNINGQYLEFISLLYCTILYKVELYLDKFPDDYHIGRADAQVQCGKVIWEQVLIYFGIIYSQL